MAVKNKSDESLYTAITSQLDLVSEKDLATPNEALDKAYLKIYDQAHVHRNKLLGFYIWYTILFSLLVFILIFLQAQTRLIIGSEQFEIIPEWGLNILTTGMFGQFIILLAIVTRKVWNFESFLPSKQLCDSCGNRFH